MPFGSGKVFPVKVLDLPLSSPQLPRHWRGFSFSVPGRRSACALWPDPPHWPARLVHPSGAGVTIRSRTAAQPDGGGRTGVGQDLSGDRKCQERPRTTTPHRPQHAPRLATVGLYGDLVGDHEEKHKHRKDKKSDHGDDLFPDARVFTMVVHDVTRLSELDTGRLLGGSQNSFVRWVTHPFAKVRWGQTWRAKTEAFRAWPGRQTACPGRRLPPDHVFGGAGWRPQGAIRAAEFVGFHSRKNIDLIAHSLNEPCPPSRPA